MIVICSAMAMHGGSYRFFYTFSGVLIAAFFVKHCWRSAFFERILFP
jgi:hypothetical protein